MCVCVCVRALCVCVCEHGVSMTKRVKIGREIIISGEPVPTGVFVCVCVSE